MLRLYWETLSALAHPKRALPIAVATGPVLLAQYQYGGGRVAVLWVAVFIVVAFVAVAPFAWRLLVPSDVSASSLPFRLLAFVAVSAIPLGLARYAPLEYGLGVSFMTNGPDFWITTVLFLVGGWGLGRDIEQDLGWKRAAQRADAMTLEAERARLLAMRAQLDPHFLFNTLNAIAEWCVVDPAYAEQAILQLSDLMRAVLEGIQSPTWSLQRELSVVRDLLHLHRARDPEAFTPSFLVDDRCSDTPIPPLLLLPLAENALKHGPSKGHRGDIKVEVSLVKNEVLISISNPGAFAGEREGGEGLAMVRRRLALAYGESAVFSIGGEERAIARILLPVAGPDGGLA
jgi:two-component system, LytTR family, sensor histidine kinase AlgZ